MRSKMEPIYEQIYDYVMHSQIPQVGVNIGLVAIVYGLCRGTHKIYEKAKSHKETKESLENTVQGVRK